MAKYRRNSLPGAFGNPTREEERKKRKKKRLLVYGPSGGGGIGPQELTYLLRDQFLTDEAAPIATPRTCEPGPGSLDILDLDNAMSIQGGEVVDDGSGIGGWGRRTVFSVADFTAQLKSGIAMFIAWTLPIASNQAAGYGNVKNSWPSRFGSNTGGGARYWGGSFWSGFPRIDDGNAHKINYILRSRGGFWIYDSKLIWPSEDDIPSGPWYAGWTRDSGPLNIDELAVLDLPANNYPKWGPDFSTITDSYSNPPLTQLFDCEADFEIRQTCTMSATMSGNQEIFARYTDGNNYIAAIPWKDVEGRILIRKRSTAGGLQTIGTVDGVWNYLVPFEITWVAQGDSHKVYVDGVLVIDITESDHQSVAQGNLFNRTDTGTTVISSHPYPALGIANARQVAPNHQDTGNHDPDCVIIIRNMQLPNIGNQNAYLHYRMDDIAERNVSDMSVRIIGDGQIRVLTTDPSATIISLGAGTVSNGDDIMIVNDGVYVELFVNNTSVGLSANGGQHLSSRTWLAWDAFAGNVSGGDATADAIEFWPRDVSSLLPAALT